MRGRARTAGATAKAVAEAGNALRVKASTSLEVDDSGRPVPGAISLIVVRGSAMQRQEILAEIRNNPNVQAVVPNAVVVRSDAPSSRINADRFDAAGAGAQLAVWWVEGNVVKAAVEQLRGVRLLSSCTPV